MLHTLGFGMPQGAEWLVIGAMGLLIFGKRLPEVGKGIGQAIQQFKKGLNSTDEEIEEAANASGTTTPAATKQLAEPAAVVATDAKFDPYTGKPVEAPAAKFDPYTGKPIGEESPTA